MFQQNFGCIRLTQFNGLFDLNILVNQTTDDYEFSHRTMQIANDIANTVPSLGQFTIKFNCCCYWLCSVTRSQTIATNPSDGIDQVTIIEHNNKLK